MAIDDYLKEREKSGWQKLKMIDISISSKQIIKWSLWAICAVLVILTIIAYSMSMKGVKTEKHYWYGEAQATIVESVYAVDEYGYGGYAYTFEYEVDGQKYEGQDAQNRVGNTQRPLTQVSILYNENNPSEFVVSNSDAKTIYFKTSELGTSLGFFGTSAIVGVFAFLMRDKKKRRLFK